MRSITFVLCLINLTFYSACIKQSPIKIMDKKSTLTADVTTKETQIESIGIFTKYSNVDEQEPLNLKINGVDMHKISQVDRLFRDKITFTDLYSKIVNFDIPEDAEGFVITLRGEKLINNYGIKSLLAPDETKLINYNPSASIDSSPNIQNYGTSRVRSILVPNHPALTCMPGTYKLQIHRKSKVINENLLLDILIKRKIEKNISEKNIWTTARVNFLFSPQGLMNAEQAQTNSEFQQKIAEFKKILASTNIELLKINFRNQKSGYSFQSKYLNDPEFDKLLAEPKTLNELNISFVKIAAWTETHANSYLVGGPSYLEPSIRSGVLIIDRNDSFQGKTFAHELGHHLGLNHNWEDKRFTDTLVGNIMSYNSDPLLHFSPEQHKVIFRHPGLPLYTSNSN